MKVEPFKSLPGAQLKIDDTRNISVFPGEDGTYLIVWHNGENRSSIRLTREAAAATAGLLTALVGNGVDTGAPPLI